jgi:hypothetical protein
VEDKVLAHVEAAVERVALGHDADLAPRVRSLCDDVDATDPGAARGGQDARRQHPGSRGLAGAVGSEEPEHFAAANHQVQPVDSELSTGVALGQPVCAHGFVLRLL